MQDPTKRFSDRVEMYRQYRPSYPHRVVDVLKDECGLSAAHVVADIGSGTGLLSKLFVQNGNRVLAIEPNHPMRVAGEQEVGAEALFHSIDGTAEDTTLDESSVDFVVAAQAFHWFRQHETRREWKRILRPNGWCAIIWNDRQVDTTPFLRGYEKLLQQYGTDYRQVAHTQIDRATMERFFEPGTVELAQLPNTQVLDWSGLKGRLLSSSYVPGPDDEQHEQMLIDLRLLFEQFSDGGVVDMLYTTLIYYGQLDV
ncbi:MAG: class I SAM-dependent methyltransferase [Herpetosiphon sp.]